MSDQGEWGRRAEAHQAPSSNIPSFAPPSNPGFRDPQAPPFAPPQQPWVPAGASAVAPRASGSSSVAVVSLVLAALGAMVGLAIGWGFPLSIVALVLAVTARKGPGSSRALVTWSVVLVVISTIASLAWLVYSIVYIIG